MIALVQRVVEASVGVGEEEVGRIGPGLVVLAGIHRDDTDKELDWVARKCANLRVFPDENGVMNRSILEAGGAVLAVSQFTLYGAVGKGNRPSYNRAAPPDQAASMFDWFVSRLEEYLGAPVETGRFQAYMHVRLINDGPVTVWIERPPPEKPSGG